MPENTSPPAGERIAKLLSRRGVASRREAERLIEAGEVSVNGKIITSPALNVTGEERITVSGKMLPAEEQARLWLYYKPEGLVTSAADEKGRDTVFDHLPEDMPRVMSIGRLDLNSEGLLLLTNDGGLKRRLELPSTGWLRKYRVRVNGQADEVKIQTLRDGITVDGEHFKPMQVTIDRQQGANAWFTIGLREGKNREIRRAMNAIGLYVNRLIRVSYGPFRLGDLQPGQVEEVKARVLRDQLGEVEAAEAAGADAGAPAAKTRGVSLRPGSARPVTVARTRSAAGAPTAKAPAGRGSRTEAEAKAPAGSARVGKASGRAASEGFTSGPTGRGTPSRARSEGGAPYDKPGAKPGAGRTGYSKAAPARDASAEERIRSSYQGKTSAPAGKFAPKGAARGADQNRGGAAGADPEKRGGFSRSGGAGFTRGAASPRGEGGSQNTSGPRGTGGARSSTAPRSTGSPRSSGAPGGSGSPRPSGGPAGRRGPPRGKG